MLSPNLPPAPDGATIYVHPQGKTIFVLADGNMVCYKPDGKRASTSATPAKLASGHGGWELYSGEAPTVTAKPEAAGAYGLAPMLATESDATALPFFVTNDSTVMEQKLDGVRFLIDTTGETVVYRTRNGKPYSKGVPTAVRNYAFPRGIIIDCELVGSTVWAFDLPISLGGVTGEPLSIRRETLETMERMEMLGPTRVVPQARTTDEKHELAKVAITDGYEGLMAKDVNSTYEGGTRSKDWLKIKFVKTADVVVMPKSRKAKAESVALGVHVDGVLTEVGQSSLIGKQKSYAIHEGDVLEVKYLYVGANGRLYQPRIVRKRQDKLPEECTGDQLVHVNKTVLEKLP